MQFPAFATPRSYESLLPLPSNATRLAGRSISERLLTRVDARRKFSADCRQPGVYFSIRLTQTLRFANKEKAARKRLRWLFRRRQTKSAVRAAEPGPTEIMHVNS